MPLECWLGWGFVNIQLHVFDTIGLVYWSSPTCTRWKSFQNQFTGPTSSPINRIRGSSLSWMLLECWLGWGCANIQLHVFDTIGLVYWSSPTCTRWKSFQNQFTGPTSSPINRIRGSSLSWMLLECWLGWGCANIQLHVFDTIRLAYWSSLTPTR